MKIKTKPYGEVQIKEEDILYIEGILGFEGYKKWVLLPTKTEGMFFWLQSLEEEGLAFVVVNPKTIRADYTPSIPEHELMRLGLEKVEDALFLAICTVPDEPEKVSVNLSAPIVINPSKKSGRQIILSNTRWSIRHYIIEELGGRA